VFVVGCLGDWERPAAVLFERESVQRDSAPRRAQRQGASADAEAGAGAGVWPADIASTLNHAFGDKLGLEDQHALHGAPLFVPEIVAAVAFTPGNLARGAGPSPNAEVAPTMKCSAGRGADDQRTCVAHAFYSKGGTHGLNHHPEVSPAVKVGSGLGIPSPPAVAQAMQVQWASGGGQIENNTAQALRSNAEYNYQFARIAMTVRRLTPRECERLQGFPDDWTMIPWRKKTAEDCPDGPRYKALGNSMAVNVMAWIGERIDNYERTGNAVRTEG